MTSTSATGGSPSAAGHARSTTSRARCCSSSSPTAPPAGRPRPTPTCWSTTAAPTAPAPSAPATSPRRRCAGRPSPWKGSASTGRFRKPSPSAPTRCTWPRSKIPVPARPRTVDAQREGEARMPGPGGDTLASVAETLAGLSAAARAGSLDDAAALAALSAVRQVTAELERGELALIEAARESGATWTRIAAATGARNRQTAQKRHADLTRRHPCPPAVDTPAPQIPDAGHDHDIPEEKALVNQDALPKGTTRPPLGPANESGHARRRLRLGRLPRSGSARPLRRSPTPSSPRAATNSSGHPTTPRHAPGASLSAAGPQDWSARPGAGSAANPDGSPSTCPDSRCRSREPAGSPRLATPGPATPLRSACCVPSSASKNNSARRPLAERRGRPSPQ